MDKATMHVCRDGPVVPEDTAPTQYDIHAVASATCLSLTCTTQHDQTKWQVELHLLFHMLLIQWGPKIHNGFQHSCAVCDFVQ